MSYSDPSLAMQKGSLSIMKAGETGALVGGRIYDGVPGGVAKPYISFGPFQMLPEHGDCLDGGEAFLTIDAWAAGPDTVQVKQIGTAIAADLDRQSITLDGQRLIELSIEQIQYLRDPDGLTAHAVVTVHAWTEPIGGDSVNDYVMTAGSGAFVLAGMDATLTVSLLPPLLDLVAASDTGPSSIDNITADATPDLDMTFPSGAFTGDIVNLYDGGSLIGSHTLTSGEALAAAFTMTIGTLANGVHPLTATVTRGGIAGPPSAVLSITIDPTAITPASITFDPAKKAATVTLTAGDLHSATSTNGSATAVLGQNGYSIGKFYYECTMVSAGTAQAVGIGSTSYGPAYTTALGFDTTRFGAGLYTTGIVKYNNGNAATANSYTNGDTVCVAVDLAAKLIWFKVIHLGTAGNWNNSGTANPATGVGGASLGGLAGGPWYPAVSHWFNTDNVTANFGGGAYAIVTAGGAVPSGFGNW